MIYNIQTTFFCVGLLLVAAGSPVSAQNAYSNQSLSLKCILERNFAGEPTPENIGFSLLINNQGVQKPNDWEYSYSYTLRDALNAKLAEYNSPVLDRSWPYQAFDSQLRLLREIFEERGVTIGSFVWTGLPAVVQNKNPFDQVSSSTYRLSLSENASAQLSVYFCSYSRRDYGKS